MEIDAQYPWFYPAEWPRDIGIYLVALPKERVCDGVILAVVHDDFIVEGVATLQNFGQDKRVFFDMKSMFPQDEGDLRL